MFGLNEVLEAAKKPFGGRGIGMRFARLASPEDLEKLAQAVMSELDAAIVDYFFSLIYNCF